MLWRLRQYENKFVPLLGANDCLAVQKICRPTGLNHRRVLQPYLGI